MINNDTLTQLSLLTRGQNQRVLIDVADTQPDVARFQPGEKVQITVLNQLPNGRFEVSVKNQQLDLNLPPNTQPGQKLDLTVLSTSPKLQFGLSQADLGLNPTPSPAAANSVITANTEFSPVAKWLGQVDAQPAPAKADLTPAAGTESGAATPLPRLSLTEMAVAAAGARPETQADTANAAAKPAASAASASTSPTAAQDPEPGAVHSSAAVRQAPVALPTPALAHALREALGQSGLFYESHQAEWVLGGRSLQQIQQEPQAQWAHAPPPEPATASSPASLAVHAGSSLVESNNVQLQGSTSTHGLALDSQVPKPMQPLVQQQLGVLDHGQLRWQGQAWPGQELQWQVEEDPSSARQLQARQGKVWLSQLKMQLPGLGDLEAQVRLHPGGRVEVQFQAETGAVERINQAKARLFEAMQGAGLTLLQAQAQPKPEASAEAQLQAVDASPDAVAP